MEKKEEREFEVEAILGHEERNGVILFHIRWRGYGPEDDTLEPIENLDGCELLLSQYLASAHLNNPSMPESDEFDFSESDSSSDHPVTKRTSKTASPKQSKTRKTHEKPKTPKTKSQKRAQDEAKNKQEARAALLAREEKKEEKRQGKVSEQKEPNANSRTTQAKAKAFELTELLVDTEPEAPKKPRAKAQETTKKVKAQETTKKVKAQETTKRVKAQETTKKVKAQETTKKAKAQETTKKAKSQETTKKAKSQETTKKSKTKVVEPPRPSEPAGFSVDFSFRDTDVFRAADVAALTVDIEHAHATLESRLANPFPIKRMNRIKKVGHAVQVECELPDNPNSVWLPFSLLQIVQPQALAKFLIETQAYLCEPAPE